MVGHACRARRVDASRLVDFLLRHALSREQIHCGGRSACSAEKLVNEATFSSPKRSDLKTPPSWVVNRAALDFAKPTVDLVELESIRRDLREQVEANAAKLLQVAQFEADFAASLSDPGRSSSPEPRALDFSQVSEGSPSSTVLLSGRQGVVPVPRGGAAPTTSRGLSSSPSADMRGFGNTITSPRPPPRTVSMPQASRVPAGDHSMMMALKAKNAVAEIRARRAQSLPAAGAVEKQVAAARSSLDEWKARKSAQLQASPFG